MNTTIFDAEKQKQGMTGLPIIIVIVAVILFFGIVATMITGTVSSPSMAYNEKASSIAPNGGIRPETVHDFTWILYPVFLGSIYFFIELSRRFVSRRQNDFGLMLSLMGAVLLLVSLLALFGFTSLAQHIQDPKYPLNLQIGWLVEAIVFGLVGLGLGFLGSKFNKGKTPLLGTFGLLVMPTLIVSTLLLLGIGLHDAIVYETPTYAIPLTPVQLFGWIPTAALFLFLAAVGAMALKKIAGAKALQSNILPLKAVGGIYLAIALILFIFGLMAVIAENFALDSVFRWLADSISFGAIGTLAFVAAMRIQKSLPKEKK